MITLFFILSLSLNIFLFWYLYKIIRKYIELTNLSEDILYKISFFQQHLESLFGLETFYGEPVIANLIEHSKVLLSSFEQFRQDYDVFSEETNDEQEVS